MFDGKHLRSDLHTLEYAHAGQIKNCGTRYGTAALSLFRYSFLQAYLKYKILQNLCRFLFQYLSRAVAFSQIIAGLIEKIRHIVPFEGKTFEVDEFLKDNAGLTVAEIELENRDESFSRPGWLSDEVTGDRRYYNSCLSKHPYSTWPRP